MSEEQSEGSGTVFGSDFPRIVEETNGNTYALSSAWVTYGSKKFVLAYELDAEGKAIRGEQWCTEEVAGADGAPSTYNDANMDNLPLIPDQDRIWARLESIEEGTAESGPLDAE